MSFNFEKLEQCRLEKKINQTDLMFELYKAGLKKSRQTLDNWEHGFTFPNAQELSVLATYFKKPITFFFN